MLDSVDGFVRQPSQVDAGWMHQRSLCDVLGLSEDDLFFDSEAWVEELYDSLWRAWGLSDA